MAAKQAKKQQQSNTVVKNFLFITCCFSVAKSTVAIKIYHKQ
jgi:hypothetical protein